MAWNRQKGNNATHLIVQNLVIPLTILEKSNHDRNESNMTDRVWHFTAFAFPFHVFFMFWLMQRVDNLLRLYHIVLMVSVALQDYALAEQYPLTLHLVAQWVWWKWRWWLLLHLSLHIWPCHYLINSFRLDKWALDNMVWCGVVWSGEIARMIWIQNISIGFDRSSVEFK